MGRVAINEGVLLWAIDRAGLTPDGLESKFPKIRQPVGRESIAHPAFSIIPTRDLARYHLPRIQDYEYPFHVFRSRVSVDVPAA
jgi:hypothetical protein